MTKDSDQVPEDILTDMTRMFVRGGGSRPSRPEVVWDCLICGRHTVRASRIHPSCRAKDPTAADTAEKRFFKS